MRKKKPEFRHVIRDMTLTMVEIILIMGTIYLILISVA